MGELKGPRFERYIRIDGPDGEMCAQCRTDWVLIDIAAKRPARVLPWTHGLATQPTGLSTTSRPCAATPSSS